MNSKSPRKAIFQSPISASDVGGDQAFGRLVAAATMAGKTVQQFAEDAAIHEVSADLGVSEEDAERLLRVLESSRG